MPRVKRPWVGVLLFGVIFCCALGAVSWHGGQKWLFSAFGVAPAPQPSPSSSFPALFRLSHLQVSIASHVKSTAQPSSAHHRHLTKVVRSIAAWPDCVPAIQSIDLTVDTNNSTVIAHELRNVSLPKMVSLTVNQPNLTGQRPFMLTHTHLFHWKDLVAASEASPNKAPYHTAFIYLEDDTLLTGEGLHAWDEDMDLFDSLNLTTHLGFQRGWFRFETGDNGTRFTHVHKPLCPNSMERLLSIPRCVAKFAAEPDLDSWCAEEPWVRIRHADGTQRTFMVLDNPYVASTVATRAQWIHFMQWPYWNASRYSDYDEREFGACGIHLDMAYPGVTGWASFKKRVLLPVYPLSLLPPSVLTDVHRPMAAAGNSTSRSVSSSSPNPSPHLNVTTVNQTISQFNVTADPDASATTPGPVPTSIPTCSPIPTPTPVRESWSVDLRAGLHHLPNKYYVKAPNNQAITVERAMEWCEKK